MEFLNNLFVFDHMRAVPRGVKLVALSRTIRWAGWGFGESLIPLFMLMFTTSFAEAGLLRSSYDIIFMLSLPVVSMFADSVSSRTLLIVALIAYPFVGLAYFLAGVTGAVIFIVLARGINGITWCLDSIGVNTYLRRMSTCETEASVFGYIESLANLGWIAAAVAGFFMVPFVPIHWLLFLVVPTSLIAIIPLLALQNGKPNTTRVAKVSESYRAFVASIRTWGATEYRIAILSFFIAIMSLMSTFFLPIAAYEGGADLQKVIIMTVIFSLPAVMSWTLANIVDRTNKRTLLIWLLVAMPPLFFVIALFPTFHILALAALIIQVVCVAAGLILNAYITRFTPRETYGSTTGAINGVVAIGSVITPIAAGFFADSFGLSGLFTATGVLAIVAGAFAFFFPTITAAREAESTCQVVST